MGLPFPNWSFGRDGRVIERGWSGVARVMRMGCAFGAQLAFGRSDAKVVWHSNGMEGERRIWVMRETAKRLMVG